MNTTAFMIQILIRYHGIFAAIAAQRAERMELPDGATLLDALRLAARRHPPLTEALFLANGEIAPYTRAFLNGTLLDDPKRPLREGDEITLLPSLSGGEAPMQPIHLLNLGLVPPIRS